jgi:hypothetical protein
MGSSEPNPNPDSFNAKVQNSYFIVKFGLAFSG